MLLPGVQNGFAEPNLQVAPKKELDNDAGGFVVRRQELRWLGGAIASLRNPIGCGSKRNSLGTTGVGLFFILPIGFFRYPFLTHSQLTMLLFFLDFRAEHSKQLKIFGALIRREMKL